MKVIAKEIKKKEEFESISDIQNGFIPQASEGLNDKLSEKLLEIRDSLSLDELAKAKNKACNKW